MVRARNLTYYGSVWNEEVKFIASDGANQDFFGCSVSINEETVFIGARFDDDYGENSGSVYVFEKGLGSDLDCEGMLHWSDVRPGDTVEGNFTLKNIGEAFSLLEWEITEYPEWGYWTFYPKSGTGLTPEDGAITVNITVIAPDEKDNESTGNITIMNKHNRSDKCTIPVYLKTPKNKPFNFNFPLISWLLERFPRMFPILRQLLTIKDNLSLFH